MLGVIQMHKNMATITTCMFSPALACTTVKASGFIRGNVFEASYATLQLLKRLENPANLHVELPVSHNF